MANCGKLHRNIDIYLRVTYGGERVTSVANLYRITPQRVSQIVRNIAYNLHNRNMIYLHEIENF